MTVMIATENACLRRGNAIRTAVSHKHAAKPFHWNWPLFWPCQSRLLFPLQHEMEPNQLYNYSRNIVYLPYKQGLD
jgi:hypothetical protein